MCRSGLDSAIALAGINSSASAQQAGQNEHLRSFSIKYPHAAHNEASSKDSSGTRTTHEKGSQGTGRIQEISRRSLFTPSTAPRKEIYQRVLRLSQPQTRGAKSRLAVIATGLAPEGEIVIFDAGTGTHTDQIRGQIRLRKGQEAADVDIIEPEDGEYHVTYCTDYEVSVCEVAKGNPPEKSSPEPPSRCIYVTPHSDVFSAGKLRPTFRALHFLTPSLILLLSNRPGRSGAELLLLRFDKGPGKIILRKRLHSSMKAGVGLEVSSLSGSSDSSTQFVIAVAGQDISIELLTLDYSPSTGIGNFQHYATFRSVHSLQMTSICLSNFIPPVKAQSGSHLRVASVSMGNTVVVQTLPLNHVGSPDRPRYVLALPPRLPRLTSSILYVLLALLLAIVSRSLFGNGGSTISYIWNGKYVPSENQAWHAKPSIMADTQPQRARLLMGHDLGIVDDKLQRVVIKSTPDGLSAAVHDSEESARADGRKWEDLEDHEREQWKRRLTKAGEWTADEGESILKGILFGELAEAVGHAIGG